MPQKTLTALINFFQRSLTRQILRGGSITQLPARLIDLPSEVLMCVVDHLPPESVLVVFLTCKTFYVLLRHEQLIARLPSNHKYHNLSSLADMPKRRRRNLLVQHLPTTGRRSNLLLDIPPELLLDILDHLPPESAMALGLTCKALYAKLPQSYKINFGSPADEQYKLLSLLARDIPNCIACPSCTRFHYNRNLHHYSGAIATRNKHGQLPACVIDDENRNMASLAPALFGSTVCRMVLEEHKLHPRSAKLLDQLYDKKATTSTSANYLKREKAEIRIIHGKLIIHEATMLTPKWACDSFMNDMEVFHADHRYGQEFASFMICPHVVLMKICYDRRFREVQTCRECHTEYRADFWTCKAGNRILAFERWIDLGLGPDDPKWDEHFPSHADDWIIANAAVPANPVKNAVIASLFSEGKPLYKLNLCFPAQEWHDLVAMKSPHRKPRYARYTDNGQMKYVKSEEATRQAATNT